MSLYKELKLKKIKYKKFLDSINIDEIKGRLEIHKINENSYKYFHAYKVDSILHRKYISKDNLELASKLANKKYYEDLIKILEKRIFQFDDILKDYQETEIEDLYNNYHQGIKNIVIPITPTYEIELSKFKSKKRSYLNYLNENNKFMTNKGEYVRSKSEKIIADLLTDFGLEYIYESSLELNDITIYPDFTIFHPTKRVEIYWEHFGRIDNEDYLRKTYNKILNYELNGYMRNDRLIVSYELNNDLNIQWIHKLIKICLLS